MEKTNIDVSDAGTRAGGTGGRLAALALALLLFLAMSLSGGKTTASSVDCLEQCQQEFALCLIQAQGDPVMESACQLQYERCAQDCPLD